MRSPRLWISAGAATVLGGGLFVHRAAARQALDDLRAMSAWSLVAVISMVLVHKVVHASLLWASLPGLSHRRALVVNEVHTGCTNSTVGGSAIGTGLKVAMLRSSGHCERAIAASIVCTGAASSFGLWGMAWVQAVPRVVLGDAKGGERLVAGAGTCVLLGSAVFWSAVLFLPAVTSFVARGVDRVLHRSSVVLPSGARRRVSAIDVPAEVARLRTLGHELMRTRFFAIAGATMASQLTIAMVLVVTLLALQPTGGVPVVGVLGVFALARVLGSLAPLPGGIGVLDVGLASGLAHLGIAQPTAIAAIALFRALTFVLPIATGMACLFIARRVDAVRIPSAPVHVAVAVPVAVTVPVAAAAA
jgi:uncharacterized membrane protein YbhN (UPF0104 family)